MFLLTPRMWLRAVGVRPFFLPIAHDALMDRAAARAGEIGLSAPVLGGVIDMVEGADQAEYLKAGRVFQAEQILDWSAQVRIT